MKYVFVDEGMISKLACLKQNAKALTFLGELK